MGSYQSHATMAAILVTVVFISKMFDPHKQPLLPAFMIFRLPFLSLAPNMQDSCCVCFEVVYFSTMMVIIPDYNISYEPSRKERNDKEPHPLTFEYKRTLF